MKKNKLNVKFRKFGFSDVKSIIKIEKESFPDPFSRIMILILAATTRFIVAMDKNQVVGYLSLGYENKKTQHIYRIAFSKTCRGKGYGAAILKKFIRSPCTVMTTLKNKGSIRFYETYGFKQKNKIKKKNKNLIYLSF